MSVRDDAVECSVQVRLEQDGWLVVPAAGSLGPVDLVALRAGERPLLVEVKATTQPWEDCCVFERAELSNTARRAGADATLAWWPAGGELRFVPEHQWPSPARAPRGSASRVS